MEERLFTQGIPIKRLSLSSKVVISQVEGQAMAGGIGIVAASDLVVASPGSQFSLSEALWGLLPACVVPYLIRRVGFQSAYKMTLTTLPISALEAHRVQLVDEVAEEPAASIRRLKLRMLRLEPETIGNLKAYFRRMWIVDQSKEEIAVDEISRLMSSPQVRGNIRNFVEHRRFPWEK